MRLCGGGLRRDYSRHAWCSGGVANSAQILGERIVKLNGSDRPGTVMRASLKRALTFEFRPRPVRVSAPATNG